MKKKISIGKKLVLSRKKLNQLNDEQLNLVFGGRMAFSTGYTSGSPCSVGTTSCCTMSPGCPPPH